jgi:prepilin-type N-terminal cleavage/methylation domain-containing protein
MYRDHPTPDAAANPTGPAKGFTLIELMVVVALVGVAVALALPSIMYLFTAGADSQAYNLIGAQLTTARAIAIRNHTYAGVHVQMPDTTLWPKLWQTCFSAIVVRDRKTGLFRVQGQPQKVPGSYAFGKIDSSTVSGGAYAALAGSSPDAFTNFTVIFTPAGELARCTDSGAVQFDATDPIFSSVSVSGTTSVTGESRLWALPANADGVLALTMFSFAEYSLLTGSNRVAYLDKYAQFLPINAHTGQLYRKD